MSFSAVRTEVDGIGTIRLRDAARNMEVSIAPSIGNLAWELKLGGENILWFPCAGPAELKKSPLLCGLPFLAPWANRLAHDWFFANGKKYLLNPELGNLRRDQNQLPIHGLVSFAAEWEVASLEAGPDGARVACRLDFWRHPDLMAQFPFAHSLEMSYRLRDGALEVETGIENLCREPMPVAVGYHPYLRIPGIPRAHWRVHVAARDRMVLGKELIPTGERRPADATGAELDDVFTNLIRDAEGRARFSIEAEGRNIVVLFGPLFQAACVYSPGGRDFICIEPMAAVTNAFNLSHEGQYPELQTVPPGGGWKESFWIVPSGF